MLTVYEVPGPSADAPTVMLLHGLGATAYLNWKPVLEPLSAQFRVLAVDHRGHGKGLRSRSCHFEDCADDVAVALDALGVGKAIVAGYSMGGPIALQVWRRHPGKVEGLILAATAMDLTHIRTWKYYLGQPILFAMAAYYHLRQRAYVRTLVKTIQRDFQAQYSDEELLSEFEGHQPLAICHAVMCTSGFSVDWKEKIDVPVISLVTLEDEAVPAATQRMSADYANEAIIMEIEADHEAMFTATEVFCERFLTACRMLSFGKGVETNTG